MEKILKGVQKTQKTKRKTDKSAGGGEMEKEQSIRVVEPSGRVTNTCHRFE